jgi:hypothetical protein
LGQINISLPITAGSVTSAKLTKEQTDRQTGNQKKSVCNQEVMEVIKEALIYAHFIWLDFFKEDMSSWVPSSIHIQHIQLSCVKVYSNALKEL